MLVLEHEIEVEFRQPRMLARDLLGARPVAGADRLEQHPMLVLGDDEDLVLTAESRL